MPCSTPGAPWPREAPWRPLSMPSPPASTPISATSASSRKARKIPMAFEPPPTQATTLAGQAPLLGEHLLARLAADHRLQLGHDLRVGRRAGRRADDVVGVAHVGDPVADGLVEGVLERADARVDRAHLGAEHPHADHVEPLARHVDPAHVDAALQAEQRGRRGRGHPVLARAGLGDDAALAHLRREQHLAERVVDLVRAGVAEVLALEVERARRRRRASRPRAR